MPADPNMKILVVDDMSTMRRIVKNIMKQLGSSKIKKKTSSLRSMPIGRFRFMR